MNSTFSARVTAMIAEDAAKLSGVAACTNPDLARRSAVALASIDHVDVPRDARSSLKRALDANDRAAVLDAFWRTFAGEIPPSHPVSSRLWVNPPHSLPDERHPCITQHTWCKKADISTMVYPRGTCFSGDFIYDDTVAASFKCEGGLAGYYDSITVFPGSVPDGAIDLRKRVLPGATTIQVVRPTEIHNYWLGWAGVNTDAAWLLQSIEDQFNLVCVERDHTENVEFVLLGVEAK